jgi:hypothetical protein
MHAWYVHQSKVTDPSTWWPRNFNRRQPVRFWGTHSSFPPFVLSFTCLIYFMSVQLWLRLRLRGVQDTTSNLILLAAALYMLS